MSVDIKISVIIICYNQEDVICRSLDSVIKQREYLHELIIADDCSTDETWSVIQKYVSKYPEYIKPYRNPNNLGMYENLQNAYRFVTGNVVLFLSGDDEFGLELFSKIYNTIYEKSLNPDLDSFAMITDFSTKSPDGKENLFLDNKLITKYNPFSLKIRNIVVARAMCESKSVFNKRKELYIARKSGSRFPSFLQEGYTDAFPFYNANQFFYIPYNGNIYHSGIGHLIKIKHKKKERLSRYENYAEDFISLFSNSLSSHDIKFLNFVDSKFKYLIQPRFDNWVKYLFGIFSIINDPFSSFILKKEVFAFIKLTFSPIKF